MTVRCTALMLVACFFLNSATHAENWTQFRGSGGQGISTEKNVPVKWSTTENVAWRVAIEGEGWSSPVYLDGRVYLTSAVPIEGGDPLDRSLRTLCLDAKNGERMWDVEVFKQDAKNSKIHNKNSHASPTPIIADGRIYVHFGTKGTACLKLDGDVVWRNDSLQYPPVHGNGGCPVLVDGVLIYSADGAKDPFVAALDAATGKQRWKKQRPPIVKQKHFSFSTPLVLKVNDRTQVISPGSNLVIAYDPANGDTIWQVDYTGYSVIPRPVYGQGLVFISTGYNKPKLIAIDPTGTGNVTDTHVKWTLEKTVSHTPSFVLVGHELYLVSDGGVATCVDAVSGKQHWQERLGGNYSSSPVAIDGKIYFQSEQGDATVIEAGTKYTLLSKNAMQARTLASYAVADSSLFIRTNEHLYRISH
ncbi:MAG: PQQ-binding-like beta-propeller repeat protein [Planctomycetota bacterium]|nr:PQQ-binding-like beta-propeller repeat protein [Planctomycetota bacterium]